MKKNNFTPIESIINVAKKGGMYILVDDEKRENEGDLVTSTSDSNAKNIIEKASISINGISLTISKVTKKGFQIWIIPHTYKLTNLSSLKKGNLVNVEIDILSKYVRNYFYEKK